MVGKRLNSKRLDSKKKPRVKCPGCGSVHCDARRCKRFIKDAAVAKATIDGCENTALGRAIDSFEKKHKRSVNVDDVVSLFQELFQDESTPQSEDVIYRKENAYDLGRDNVYTLDVITCQDDTCGQTREGHELIVLTHRYIYRRSRAGFILEQNTIEYRKVYKIRRTVTTHQDTVPQSLENLRVKRDTSRETLEKSFQKFWKDAVVPALDAARDGSSNNLAYVAIIEDILFLSFAMYMGTDPMVMFAFVASKFREHTGHSISSALTKFVLGAFDDVEKMLFSKDADDKVTQSFEYGDFFSYLKQAQHLILFKKMNGVLSLIIAMGFIDPIRITVHNIEVFANAGMAKLENATDLFTYVLDLVHYFFSAGCNLFHGQYESVFAVSELAHIDATITHLSTNMSLVIQGNYEKYNPGRTVGDFRNDLMKTHRCVTLLLNTTHDRLYKQTLYIKLEKLGKMMVTLKTRLPLSGLRVPPYVINMFGGSSVGKSSAIGTAMRAVLEHNDVACGDENICTIQPSDRFWSSYHGAVTGVLIDDLANAKFEKTTVDPCNLVVTIANSIRMYANMADTEDKGAIQVEPTVLGITTNVKNIDADRWSNEPVSIIRRFNIIVTCTNKPEYVDDRGLAPELFTDKVNLDAKATGIYDIWWFKVEKIRRVPAKSKHTSECYDYDPIIFEGEPMLKVDIYTLLRFIHKDSAEYLRKQREFVKNFDQVGKRMQSCKICCNVQAVCTCPPPLVENKVTQSMEFNLLMTPFTIASEAIANRMINMLVGAIRNLIPSPLDIFQLKMVGYYTSWSYGYYLQQNYLNLIRYIPVKQRRNWMVEYFYTYIHRHELRKGGSVMFLKHFMAAFLCMYCLEINIILTIIVSFLIGIMGFALWQRDQYYQLMIQLGEEPVENILTDQQRKIGGTVLRAGVCVATGLFCIMTIRKFYKGLLASVELAQVFKTFSNAVKMPLADGLDEIFEAGVPAKKVESKVTQGDLNPTTVADIEQRDSEVNVWKHEAQNFTGCSFNRTMTAEQLCSKISPNMLHICMGGTNGGARVGAIALGGNRYMAPLHFFKKQARIWEVMKPSNISVDTEFHKGMYELEVKKTDSVASSTFTGRVSRDQIVQIGQHDLCVFIISAGGSFPDILPYFRKSNYSGYALTLGRKSDGSLKHGAAKMEARPTDYKVPWVELMGKTVTKYTHKIVGGDTVYNFPTYEGMCCTVLIPDVVGPYIGGLHIAGVTNRQDGSYMSVDVEEIQVGLARLAQLNESVTVHSASDLKMVRFGKNIEFHTVIPDNIPINYIKNANYRIWGQVGSQSTYYTEIRKSILCKSVEEHFNMECLWAGPKFGPKTYLPWHTFLVANSDPGYSVDDMLLVQAKNDYIEPLVDKMYTFSRMEDEGRPLTMKEVINGIPGKRGIDSMNFGSGFGYPMQGKKRKFLLGEPGNFTFENQAQIDEEFAFMKNCYINRQRCYPLFKACLKDEATKKTKDKVRVFHAADMVLQVGWRTYGLPILRFLSTYPLLSECAVGINPYGSEWDQLHKFITHDGKANSRILAGDYKGYDITLPSNVILMAFSIVIELARLCPGYTEEDMLMLEGLTTDTAYYICHFNGTLIEFTNGVPSGHNLTAHINSIANALLYRSAYIYYKNPMPFRKHCHMMTYGDDFEGGILPSAKRFDHVLFRDFLKAHNITMTMPDKSSEARPFLDVSETDFLKRRSVKCDIDGQYYGALDLESMLKSLMVHGKVGVRARPHASAVLEGFIRDLSYHERGTFEEVMPKIRAVIEDVGLFIPTACLNYDKFYEYRNEPDRSARFAIIDAELAPLQSDGYPMTPTASDSDEDSLHYVSSVESSDDHRCDSSDGSTTPGNFLNKTRYPSTIVLEECEAPSSHDEDVKKTPHSQVFGTNEGITSDAPTATGTAVFSSSQQHHVQSLGMVSKDELSLRQDGSRNLGSYLSRPLRIFSSSLVGQVNQRILPLELFLSNPKVREKVRGYAYMNAILHIKAQVVASPQCSGAMQIALHPWWARDNALGRMSALAVDFIPDQVQRSQLPSFVLDYSAETGGEISMPIICPSNGLNISETDQIRHAFALHINSLVPTLIPVGSAQVPTVVITCWLSDVYLTATTLTSELSTTPQSDEYQTDNSNIPSSDTITLGGAIKEAGTVLLGKATEIGIASAMAAMGLSNPNSMEGVTPHVPRLLGNMSTYNAPCNIDSLAGDYKNEVPIDSKLLGFLDYDHMNLNNILSRWSLFGIINQPCGVYSATSNLDVLPVTPLGVPGEILNGRQMFTPTPLAIATLPFNKWRGAIKYRFQVIGSAFVRGKMKISHDAIFPKNLLNYDAFDLQQLNSVIWDLATHKSIEIMVPWASNLAFKDTGVLRDGIQNPAANGDTVIDNACNGALIMSVFAPVQDAAFGSVSILVYVAGVPGMAFGDMRAVLANYTFAGFNDGSFGVPIPQSQEEPPPPAPDPVPYTVYTISGPVVVTKYIYDLAKEANSYFFNNSGKVPQSMIYQNDVETNILSGDTPDTIMAVNINGLEDNPEDHDKFAMICMGEKWFSVRQIVKRYTHNWTRRTRGANSQQIYRVRVPDRPIMKGWQGSQSLHLEVTTSFPTTYARDSFLSFFSVCFLGYRGSFRHKVCLTTSNATNAVHLFVTRSGSGYVEERVLVNGTSAATTAASLSVSASSILAMPDVRAGGTLGNTSVNPIVEYSTPFVCRAKFAWAQDRTPQVTKFSDDGGYDIPWHQICAIQSGQAAADMRIDKFIAAGDDFSLFFFMYAPRMSTASPGIYSQS